MFIIVLLVFLAIASIAIEAIKQSAFMLLVFGPVLLFMLYHILRHLYQKSRTIFTKYIKKWKARACKEETTGKIIANERTEQVQWIKRLVCIGFMILGKDRNSGKDTAFEKYVWDKDNYTEFVYNTIVEYKVQRNIYTIHLGEFDYTPEIIGRKVKVLYDENEPSKAYARTKRKHKKHLRILQKEGMYFYCECGLRKNIELPAELVDERGVPGMFLIEKYGYYHLEEREERKKDFTEMLENSLTPQNPDDYM